MKKNFLIVAVAIIGSVLALVGGLRLNRIFQERMLLSKPEHGICFAAEADVSSAQGKDVISEVKEAIRKRFYRFGAQIFWEPISQREFRIYVPIRDKYASDAGDLVWQRGLLEMRLVHMNSQGILALGGTAEGYELLKARTAMPSGRNAYQSYLVKQSPEGGTSGIRIKQAMVMPDSRSGAYDIMFNLTPESAEAFRKITRENIGRQLAIVMDGVLLSAPIIRDEIPGGAGVISGNFERLSAVQLASLMESPLPVPVKLLGTKSF
jgi:preprotein translocase subunit SecD